uniref:Integrase, catalytic region, zinc finger, CCHC-type, peptidase aspartic, catalytic n=1 Tax=Tanacetum cinerariifolium TaxID=118510 RepID=A0A6L2JCU7_TANCI|nr:integrase, catalytic region, zinc finger, CCHC-type, peptidase aspartic, catalytic [Tanacetum cinerariifolium]
MWRSIKEEPYERPLITDPDDDKEKILKPLSKMTESNKKQYIADVKVMNYLLQAILNDIYNSVGAPQEGESLESVYEGLTTLVNFMDRNNVRLFQCQSTPCFSIACNPSGANMLSWFITTKQKIQFHMNSYYQGELHWDSQEDKLTTAMMLLARAITQKFSTPTNNRLCTSSNTRNQAAIKDGRVEIHAKNAGYGGNGHYARNGLKLRVRDAKYFREQMLLAMKDEAGSNLNDEENDFILDKSFGDETLEELTAERQNASHKMIPKAVHEHKNHGKRKTVINIFDDEQINSNIIFDDPFVENNGASDEHDSAAHDQYYDVKILAYNASREAENQKRFNNELKKKKILLQKELVTYSRVKRALFTSPVAAKSRNLGTTSVVTKSRFSVAKTPTATNKVSDLIMKPEFKNEKLWSFYSKLGIVHHTSIAQKPSQNGFIERQNHTVIKAACTMLFFSKSLEFLWTEAIAIACFTRNRSILYTRYNKTPYELIRRRNPNVQYFLMYGSLCYPTNNHDDLGKMKPKADIDNFAANTLDVEDTPSPSSILIEDSDAL